MPVEKFLPKADIAENFEKILGVIPPKRTKEVTSAFR